jgi:hypothetical protein
MSTTTPVEFYDGPETATEEPPPHPASASALSESLGELEAQLEGPGAPELPAERERTLRAPGFTRMQITWSPEHAPMIKMINTMAASRIRDDFADLFEIMEDIDREARQADPATGELTGAPDYARIPERQKQHWVLELSVRLVEWEQRAAVYWGEAMAAKVIRQEVFTEAYLKVVGRSTVEDRTQAGQSASLQDYYFAVLCALLHKHAAAACASAERLCQRLKDFCSVR